MLIRNKLLVTILFILTISTNLIAKNSCQEGIDLYYQNNFIKSNTLLKQCIADKSSPKDITNSSFYLMSMMLEGNVFLIKQKDIDSYFERLIKYDFQKFSYVMGLYNNGMKNYKGSSLEYLKIIEPMMLTGGLKNIKTSKLDKQTFTIDTISTNKIGKINKVSVTIQTFDKKNIDKLKNLTLKVFLAYKYEDIIKKETLLKIQNDINTLNGNLEIIKYIVNDTTIVKNKNTLDIPKELKSSSDLLSFYKVGDIYHKSQQYKKANMYFKNIAKILLYQDIYGQNAVYKKTEDKSLIESILNISTNIYDSYIRKYNINITFSINSKKAQIDIKKLIIKILRKRSTEELLTVGGLTLLEKMIGDKIKQNISIVSYSIFKKPVKMVNKIVVKPKNINKISNLLYFNYGDLVYSFNKSIQTYKRSDQRISNQIDLNETITSIATSKYNNNIFIGTQYGEIIQKNLKDEKENSIIKPKVTKKDAHLFKITNLKIHPQHQRILVSSSQDTTVSTWDYKNIRNKKIFVKQLSGMGIVTFALPSTSKKIYFSTLDNEGYAKNSVLYYNLAKNKGEIEVFYKHSTLVSNIIISKDDKYLVSVDLSGTIKIADLKSHKVIKTIKKDDKYSDITALAITDDNKHIITSYKDSNIIVWDITTGKLVKTLDNKTQVNSIILDKSNNVIVTSNDGSIRYIDLETNKIFFTIYPFENKESLTIYEDGTYYATKNAKQYFDISIKPFKR